MWTTDDLPDQSRRTAVVTGASPSSHDRAAQVELWQVSERLSGISYPLPDAQPD